MAATMLAFDHQVRGRLDGLNPGSDDATALAAWCESFYGRRPDGNTVSAVGGELGQWFSSELGSSTPVIVDDQVWKVLGRLGLPESPVYEYGVGIAEEPTLPLAGKFVDQPVTVILPEHLRVPAQTQDATPGAGQSIVAAMTAHTDGDTWVVTEWCDATAALGDLDMTGFAAMQSAAADLPPWILGGAYATTVSGTSEVAVKGRILRASSRAEEAADEVEQPSSLSILASVFDVVTCGLASLEDVGPYWRVGPPADAR